MSYISQFDERKVDVSAPADPKARKSTTRTAELRASLRNLDDDLEDETENERKSRRLFSILDADKSGSIDEEECAPRQRPRQRAPRQRAPRQRAPRQRAPRQR
jgi:hypothetical protein